MQTLLRGHIRPFVPAWPLQYPYPCKNSTSIHPHTKRVRNPTSDSGLCRADAPTLLVDYIHHALHIAVGLDLNLRIARLAVGNEDNGTLVILRSVHLEA